MRSNAAASSSSTSTSLTTTLTTAEMSTFVETILRDGNTMTANERRKSTRKLMNILREASENDNCNSSSSSSSSYLERGSSTRTKAITALKTLGRITDGTEDLASEEGIQLLLELSGFNRSNCFLIDPIASDDSEAIRCLANVCLLHEPARVRLAAVPKAAEAILRGGEESTDPMTRFLASRLLFLISISAGTTIIALVEQLQIAKYLSLRDLEDLEDLCTITNIDNASPVQRLKYDTLVEYLKVVFNVSHFYPKMLAERPQSSPSNSTDKMKPNATASNNHNRLNSHPQDSSSSSSSSKSRSRSTSPTSLAPVQSGTGGSSTSTTGGLTPATSPSMTMPQKLPKDVASTNPSISTSSSPASRPKSPNLSKTATEKIKGIFSRKVKEEEKPSSTGFYIDADVLKAWHFEEVISAVVQLALCLPFAQGPDCGPFGAYKHVLTALLNFNLTTYSTIIFAPLAPALAQAIPDLPNASPNSSNRTPPSLPPLPARLLTLLDACCAFYIPGTCSPDDEKARAAALSSPGVLDEGLQALLLLLAKCAAEDSGSGTRQGLKECLLPIDIDRSIGLEKRSDLTGRLIRLLNSTYLAGSATAAGKFLFAVCKQDPSAFVGAIGYGNASGVLQSMNMLIPPGPMTPDGTPATGRSPDGFSPSITRPINPITGIYDDSPNTGDEAQMTDEEKEREAERLFTLFERMNRNGAMSVVNPVKEAQQTGKLTTTVDEEESDRQKLQQEEDEDEREALAEMLRYKERKQRKTT